jgi:hypothetical protein
MNILVTIFCFFYLGYQVNPESDEEIIKSVVLQYLDSRSSYNSEKKYYVSDHLDTVNKRMYQRVLDPKNEMVYNKLTETQKGLVAQLLEIREPYQIDLTNLFQTKKYGFYPDDQAPKDLFFDWNASKIKFSKLSFSSSMDEVCLILEFYCGTRCGEGVLLFARKEEGSWKIVTRRSLWVS